MRWSYIVFARQKDAEKENQIVVWVSSRHLQEPLDVQTITGICQIILSWPKSDSHRSSFVPILNEIFADRDILDVFHTYLADHIDVTVVGQEFDVGSHYNTLKAFYEAIYTRVSAALNIETIRVEAVSATGGGDSAWAAVESSCKAMSKSGG